MSKLAAICVVVMTVAVTTGGPAAQGNRSSHHVTKEDYQRWKKELSNWGRWGKDDELGALNLITLATRRRAVSVVKEGFSVSLARDAETEKAVDNPTPYDITYTMGLGPDGHGIDALKISYHGYAHTHLDGLGHVGDAGKMYNGFVPDKAQTAKEGLAKNSIHILKNGILTRGILMDIPRLKGVPYLEPGTSIYVEDLEAWEKKAGVRVSAGDALFIYTGRWARRAKVGPWNVATEEAGLDASVIPWLRQRDIAFLGSDDAQAVMPAPEGLEMAAHNFASTYLGVHLFDNCDLEAVAQAAAARKRWEFMLTAAPLPTRGTGSPINPIATF